MSVGIIAGNILSATVVSATKNLPSVSANTTSEENFTVTGVKVGDLAFITKPTYDAGLVVTSCYVSAADNVKVTVANVTASPIDSASQTFYFLVVRPENPTGSAMVMT